MEKMTLPRRNSYGEIPIDFRRLNNLDKYLISINIMISPTQFMKLRRRINKQFKLGYRENELFVSGM